MKRNTEITEIYTKWQWIFNLPFLYQLISYKAEALKALQEAVKAIEPFIAITFNWTIPLGSCMSSSGGKSRMYYVANYV